jgi:hypothetical protein
MARRWVAVCYCQSELLKQKWCQNMRKREVYTNISRNFIKTRNHNFEYVTVFIIIKVSFDIK